MEKQGPHPNPLPGGEGARTMRREGQAMRPRFQFTIRQMMIGVACIAIVFAGLAWFARALREASRVAATQSRCTGNLKWVGLALHNYHSAWGCLPPAITCDANGKPMHSWRTLILPYISSPYHVDLYNQYNFSEPWNGPNNSKLLGQMTDQYSCPTHPQYTGGLPGHVFANFVALVGPDTAFPGTKCVKFSDVRDGTANTIMLVEVASSDINWMEPRDLDVGTMSFQINEFSPRSISSYDPYSPNFLFADGMCRRLKPSTSPQTLKALMTINGGESIDIEKECGPP